MKIAIEELKKAIESLHSCSANFLNSVSVKEEFEGHTAWEGTVCIFELKGHQKTDKCYAWSSPIEGTTKRKFYAVLHIPPVDSPGKAVRASIVQDYRSSGE